MHCCRVLLSVFPVIQSSWWSKSMYSRCCHLSDPNAAGQTSSAAVLFIPVRAQSRQEGSMLLQSSFVQKVPEAQSAIDVHFGFDDSITTKTSAKNCTQTKRSAP